MFKKTKILSLVLALMLVFSLAACGGNTTPVEEPETPVVEEVQLSVTEEAVNNYFANMPGDIYKKNQKEFVDMVINGDDLFVLDIRTAEDYANGHIKGAFNAPWGPAVAENLESLPTDQTIYLYCYSGQTAGQTVATLNIAGFDAKSVNLGWNFGISRVEGYEDATEMEANEFDAPTATVDPEIKAALVDYFNGLLDVEGTTYGDYKISEASLKQLMDEEDDSIYILSIRDQADYDQGHIEGAAIIPFGNEMYKEFGTLPMDQTIVVYCYTGQTAGQTTAALRLLGYDAVSLNGGMGMDINAPLGWNNQGFPVVQ